MLPLVPNEFTCLGSIANALSVQIKASLYYERDLKLSANCYRINNTFTI